MRIFVYLNDCILGENTTMELFFIYMRNHSLKETWQLLLSSNPIKDQLLLGENKMEFDNLFLRREVIEAINNYRKTHPDTSVEVVTDLKNLPIDLLEIEGQVETCTEKNLQEALKTEENYMLMTGDFFKNIKYFFKAQKTFFVGPYLVGKLVDMMTVGRTTIIDQPYGIFSIIWDYFCNPLGNIYVLWPLLFFLPSTSFELWKYAFFFSIILTGFASLWRHLLELENERVYAVKGQEVLMGGNFIFLHHSTLMAVIISFIFLYLTIFFGLYNWTCFKALIFSGIYSGVHFLFMARKNKEYVIAKMLITIILPLLLQPSFLSEFLAIKFAH